MATGSRLTSAPLRKRKHSRDELVQERVRLHEHGEVSASFDGDERFSRRVNRGHEPSGETRGCSEVLGALDDEHRQGELAAEALSRAERRWLSALISRRVPLARWREAFEQRDNDIKVVVDFTA